MNQVVDLPGYPAQVPLPDHPRIWLWEAALWRAFGHWDFSDELVRRSFDQGAVRLPDESADDHLTRVDRHKRLDRAERELLDLLALDQLPAQGRRPATDRNGVKLQVPSLAPAERIPAASFNHDLACGADGTLHARQALLSRMFPSHSLHGSDADPRYALWHDVTVETSCLKAIWPVPPVVEEPDEVASTPSTKGAERKFTRWLTERMRQSPEASPGKEAIMIEAAMAGHQVKGRAFQRSWIKAGEDAPAPAWSKPGAKSKQ